MAQKNYNTLIIENLLRSSNHVRGVAEDIGTNQTTASRKLQELYEENVVDFRYEGKNKVFFLKRSLETKQYACIAELHKAIRMIRKYPFMRKIFNELRRNENFHLVILFGSYAKGSPGKHSDIDIYIETTDPSLKKQAESIDSRVRAKIGKYDKDNILIKEIQKNHVIIKGVEEYYEKNSIPE
jgi:predicted nucleotidyltransferase